MNDKNADAKFRGMWNPTIRDPVVNPNRFVQPIPPPQKTQTHYVPPPEVEVPLPVQEKEISPPFQEPVIPYEEPEPEPEPEPEHEPSPPAPQESLPNGTVESRKGNVKINPDATSLLRAAYDVNIERFLECLNSHPELVNVAENLHGYTPLLVAAETSNDQHALFMVKHLVEAGADLNYRDASGFTAFLQACSKGNLETVKYLVSLGVDVNQKNSMINASGFYLASEKEHFATMQYLHSLGADVNNLVVKGFQSYPALLMCAQKGNLELVKWLVDNGADINIKCRTVEKNAGIKVLHHSSGLGQLEIVRYLLSKGANIHDKENALKASPIIFAAATGKSDVVELLISHGANVNERRGDGAFPLFLASQNGHVKTVKVLLTAGAQPNMLFGKLTPLAIAKKKNHVAIVQILSKDQDCCVM